MRRFVLALLLICLTPQLAHAADPLQKRARLLIRHYANQAVLVDSNGTPIETGPIESAGYGLRSTDSITVVLEDPNPLLFDYTFTVKDTGETASFGAVKGFEGSASALAGLLQALTGGGGTAGGAAGTVGGLLRQSARFGGEEATPSKSRIQAKSRRAKALVASGVDEEFVQKAAADFLELAQRADAISGLIAESARSGDSMRDVRAKVVKWEFDDLKRRVNDELKVLTGAPMKTLKNLSGGGSALLRREPVAQIASLGAFEMPLAQDIGSSQTRPPAGTTPPPQDACKQCAAQRAAAAKNKKKTAAPAPPKPVLVEVAKPVVVEVKGSALATADDTPPAPGAVQLEDVYEALQEVRPKIEDALVKVDAFVKTALMLGSPKTFDQVVKYKSTQNQGGTLNIKPVSSAGDALKDSPLKSGDFTFQFVPSSPVEYKVDGAMLYSFLERPEFKVVENAGVKTIQRTDSGDAVNGTSVGAMLSIVPRGWSDPTFGGAFQIGFSPQRDKIGIFAGAAIRLFDRLSLGGGLAYQQTQRLARGLTEGKPVSSEDELKTRTLFKPGAYVTITVTVR